MGKRAAVVGTGLIGGSIGLALRERAKGLSEQMVVMQHALRNALLLAIGATGVILAHLLGGAVIIETIFTWPGLGQLIVGAALTRDYPVVQGFVTYLAVIVLLANLATDIALRIADPRLRYERVGV